MRSAALLLLALLALAAQARASDDQGVAVGGAGATAEMSALVPAALAANDEDDAASYADRYASDPAGGVISVAPAPLDPSFLPNFNCRKFAVSVSACLLCLRVSRAVACSPVARNASSPAHHLRPTITPPKQKQLIKTHKTGSTTLGSVLFRAAAQQGLRVHPGPHVDSDAEVPAEKRGVFDVVLQHNRRGCLAPGELPRLLAHYSALLGTDDFTVVTTVRHPVARFLSHFYFFAADELERATGKPADLAALVKERGYNNLTSCVFGVQQLEEAVALVNSSLFRRMFFIPVEYLHEGVAMLSRRCGWGSSGSGEGGGSDTAAAVEAALGGGAGGEAGGQESDASSSSSSSSSTALSATTAMTETATGTGSATSSPPPPPSLGGSGGSNAAVFLNVNENSGDRGGHVRPSLRMDHFARNDPSLLRNMAEINSVDLFLYGAALAQFRERLAADAPSSLAVAAHLRAAQQRLGARCQGASRDWNAAPSMCSWLALYDTIYLSTVDDRTGLVNWETVVSGRPLSRLRREAERDVALLLPPARPFFVVAGAAVVSPAAVSGASSSSGAAATGATAASTAESALATPEAIEAWSEALLRAGAQRVYLAHATAAPAGAAAGAGDGAATLTTPSAPAPAATPLVLSPRTQARVGSGEVVVLELGTHGDGGGFAAPAAAASAAATDASSPLPGAAEAAAYAALTAAMRRAASWGLVVGIDERVMLAPGVRGLPWALADAERESPLVAQACAPVLLATERADASALLGGGGGGGAAGDNLDVAPSHLRPSAARLSRGVRCAARLANVRALRPHLHAPVHEGRAQALCAPAPAFWGEGGLHGGGADGEAGSLTASSAASASSSSSAVGGNGGGGATTQAAVAALGAYVEGASSSSPGSSASAAVAAAVPAADSAAAPPSSIARLYGPAANCIARPMFFGIATADALEQDAEVVAATGSSGGGGSTVAGERVAAAAAAAAADEATMRPSITRRR